MKKLIIYLAIVTIGVMGWTTYAGAAPDCSQQAPCTKLANGKLCGDCAICGGCGEIKGGENCCVADAAKCPHCGLNAGSPGCCTIEPGKDIAICGGCGQIKGGEDCCVADAVKCSHCGFNAGSLGCSIRCKVVTGLLMEEERDSDFIVDNI